MELYSNSLKIIDEISKNTIRALYNCECAFLHLLEEVSHLAEVVCFSFCFLQL